MSQDPWYEGDNGQALELCDSLVNGNLTWVADEIVASAMPAVLMSKVSEMLTGPGQRATLQRGVERAYERKS